MSKHLASLITNKDLKLENTKDIWKEVEVEKS